MSALKTFDVQLTLKTARQVEILITARQVEILKTIDIPCLRSGNLKTFDIRYHIAALRKSRKSASQKWPYRQTAALWSRLLRSRVLRSQLLSRLFKIIGLFCKRDLQKRRYSAKETCNFKAPTHRCHLIRFLQSHRMTHNEYQMCLEPISNVSGADVSESKRAL